MKKLIVVLMALVAVSVSACASAPNIKDDSSVAMAKEPNIFQLSDLEELVKTCKHSGSFTKTCIKALQTLKLPNMPVLEGCTAVDVDYDIKMVEMVKAYKGVVAPVLMTGDFHPRAKGKVKRLICRFAFGQYIALDEAKSKIEADGNFLVADIYELHALGLAKPDLPMHGYTWSYLIYFALGSPWRDEAIGSLMLEGERDNRYLSFDGSVKEEKNTNCRYVAIRTTPKPNGCVKTEVNYNLKPADMAKGYGRTDFDIRDFKATPRAKGKVQREICWFRFGQNYTAEEVKMVIEADGNFLVADIYELHALGLAKPDPQRKLRFIALGSVWQDPRYDLRWVPELTSSFSKRELELVGSDFRISGRTNLVAIRK